MAPLTVAALTKRYTCYRSSYSYYDDDDCYSPWYSWGRWIVLAAVLVGAVLLFLMFACITARRRRRRGMQPYRGTGWVPGAAPGGAPPAQWGGQAQPAQPAQGYYGNNASAPPYSPTAQPAYNQGYNYNQSQGYGANQGYFGGGQQTGVELQQPNPSHVRAGENVYQPPSGAPPKQ